MNERGYDLELTIAKVLRYGVLIAGILMLVGWISAFQTTGNPLLEFSHFEEKSLSSSLDQCIEHGRWGILIAYIGLGCLISLPLIRVLLTALVFLRQKEFVLASVAIFVAFSLLISIAVGFNF